MLLLVAPGVELDALVYFEELLAVLVLTVLRVAAGFTDPLLAVGFLLVFLASTIFLFNLIMLSKTLCYIALFLKFISLILLTDSYIDSWGFGVLGFWGDN